MPRPLGWLWCVAVCAAACSHPATNQTGSSTPPATPATTPAGVPAEPPAPAVPPDASQVQGDAAMAAIERKWTGDFDGMMKRRAIRAAVVYSKTHYFIDHGVQHGMAYESLALFEDEINKKYKTGTLKVNVVFVPLTRDQLLPALQDGRVDLVTAMLTVTPERQQLVDFSNPTRTDVSEIVITGPGGPTLAGVEDLSGREVFVRQSTSYYRSLVALNDRLTKAGKPPVILKLAPEQFEDEDMIEMVNAGLVKVIIVDDYLATYWKQVFPNIVLHNNLALRTGGDIAVAMRKGSPKLMGEVNAWIKRNGPKTMFGNMMLSRYLQSTKFVKNAASEADMARFTSMVNLFQKYGNEYNLDWLLMAAQGYQESGLDQSVRSKVGAIGVMQVMPETGRDMRVGDVSKLDANIHAGVKYIRFMVDQYFKNEPMDELNKGLFAFAAYNAGPGRIQQLRQLAAKRGLNPNVWFNNVEQIVSEKIGRETVTYVSNIYKYYVAYKLALEIRNQKKAAQLSGDFVPRR